MYFDTLSSFLDAGKSRQDSRLAPRMSRRQFGSLAVVATVVAAFEPTASFAAETFDLRPDLDRLPLRQIKVSIAVRGELKLNADGKKGSLFDALEDLDVKPCAAKALDLHKLNQKA